MKLGSLMLEDIIIWNPTLRKKGQTWEYNLQQTLILEMFKIPHKGMFTNPCRMSTPFSSQHPNKTSWSLGWVTILLANDISIWLPHESQPTWQVAYRIDCGAKCTAIKKKKNSIRMQFWKLVQFAIGVQLCRYSIDIHSFNGILLEHISKLSW